MIITQNAVSNFIQPVITLTPWTAEPLFTGDHRGQRLKPALRQVQTEVDVDCRRRMRDCAAGNIVGAGFGVRTRGGERDAAGKFNCGAACDMGDPFPGLGRSQVVQEQVRRAAR